MTENVWLFTHPLHLKMAIDLVSYILTIGLASYSPICISISTREYHQLSFRFYNFRYFFSGIMSDYYDSTSAVHSISQNFDMYKGLFSIGTTSLLLLHYRFNASSPFYLHVAPCFACFVCNTGFIYYLDYGV